ncbi:MAG: hypothetical protein AMXMBFR82_06610 [Candidatus Hydrogenedentota bacterium]
MTDGARRSRREIAISMIFFMPTWSLWVLQEHHPLLPLCLTLFGRGHLLALLYFSYTMAFGFALSAARMDEGMGRKMGFIALCAVSIVGLAFGFMLLRPNVG